MDSEVLYLGLQFLPAKWMGSGVLHLGLQFLPAWGMVVGVLYMGFLIWRQNKTPVRSPPWGPPQGKSWKDDVAPLNFTHMDLCERYDLINLIAHDGTFTAFKSINICECYIILMAFE